MPMRSTWDTDDDAGTIVASIVIGRATPTDVGGRSEKLHDFDVERFDGTRLAVEVTRCTDPNTLQTAEPFGAFGSRDMVRGLAEPHVQRAIDAVWLVSTLNLVVRSHRQEGWRDFGLWRA